LVDLSLNKQPNLLSIKNQKVLELEESIKEVPLIHLIKPKSSMQRTASGNFGK